MFFSCFCRSNFNFNFTKQPLIFDLQYIEANISGPRGLFFETGPSSGLGSIMKFELRAQKSPPKLARAGPGAQAWAKGERVTLVDVTDV